MPVHMGMDYKQQCLIKALQPDHRREQTYHEHSRGQGRDPNAAQDKVDRLTVLRLPLKQMCVERWLPKIARELKCLQENPTP